MTSYICLWYLGITGLYKCYNLRSLHSRTEVEYTVNDLDATVKRDQHLHVSVISNVINRTSIVNAKKFLNNGLWDNAFRIFALSTLYWEKRNRFEL
jgi:hypothetical protein